MENEQNSNFNKASQTNDDIKHNNHAVIQVNRSYCGLTNQGTTCYLNSLLQSLFMTPEFRQNILQWEFHEKKHGKKDDCIMFQLQKLFARMQLKFFQEEETKDLTKSFQWDSKEIFQQHDIQELCRVLFDAIELTLGKSPTFINRLYEGTMRNEIQCLKCRNKSYKVEKFMDLSLPVRSEFEKIYNSSLEMALFNLIKPERLEKDNQYFCEQCRAKVDAIKYISFVSLPKILIVQFNRFEYDVKSDSRRKLFDKVTFPQILNMNTFLQNYSDITSKYKMSQLEYLREREVSIDNHQSKEHSKKLFVEGPHVYDLYSIVLHSGNALGGHYFVYIKSFEDSKKRLK